MAGPSAVWNGADESPSSRSIAMWAEIPSAGGCGAARNPLRRGVAETSRHGRKRFRPKREGEKVTVSEAASASRGAKHARQRATVMTQVPKVSGVCVIVPNPTDASASRSRSRSRKVSTERGRYWYAPERSRAINDAVRGMIWWV